MNGTRRLLATATLAATMVAGAAIFFPRHAAATQNFPNGRVADVAIADVGHTYPTGWNQPGECIKRAQAWVIGAGGSFGGGGVLSSYTSSGASQVPMAQATRGDILQLTDGYDNDWSHTHTVAVVNNNGNGTYSIVQGNVPLGSGLVSANLNWRPFIPPPAGTGSPSASARWGRLHHHLRHHRPMSATTRPRR